ncbi:hypothetical protein SLEP1_g35699 [Rubroshorea leprosula]|uniref:AAA+ ATPase domain-containing protein n=1 Tax=Rubroshorea leprosula TaxID=152421 RepID=A0AAV5KPK2_9ROSI|nr:hypothetical protein SLEP1_g35699 [Rubroshorea leprosula]
MAQYGTAVATAVVGKVTEKLFDRILKLIWSPITRVFKWKANIRNQTKKLGELKDESKRVQQFIDAAERRGDEAGSNVKNWLDRADKFIGEMEKLGDDEANAEKKCFAGVCPNCKARYQISKKAEENLEAIAQLLKEAAKFKIPDSYRAPARAKYATPVEGFVDFGSRNSALSGIMEALRSATVHKIGLYGMPGVGKTMLAQEVARQATEAQLFDEIVMVSVKKNPELKRIQGEIADQLGVQLQRETESGRADQLKEYLKKKKRILVILDDIWTRLDLDGLGIPFEDKKNDASLIGEEKMQCKILLTSRDFNVLSSIMHTHTDFPLGPLEDEEPWELFKKIVGHEIEKPDLRLTALEIAKECAGLPLAVEVLGNALKGRPPHAWRDALRELQRPSPANFEGLLGRNASIEDLIRVGVGLDLFHNVKTIEEARDRVQTLVSDLKSYSLLRDAHSNIQFDMHDIVHDVTVSIASRDHHFKSFKDDHVPNWEELRSFKWISLENVDIGELPDQLECPQLTLFFLSSKDPCKKIRENLFLGTQELRVLSFTNMHLSSLPSSLCLLKNLRTLLINGSVLEDVALIGKMVCLEVLSLSGCDIGELPMEIGQLTQLKLLDLSDCIKLKVIPPRVLASLSRLEELYLGNSFDQWDIVGENGNQRNAGLSEFKDLSNLAALDIHVCDVHLIPEGFFSQRLERYKIFIGEVGNRWDSSFNSSKILKLQLNTSISYDHSIGMLMKKTEELHLEGLKSINHVVNELDAEGFQELKYLYVQNALEVKQIVNSVEYAFPILEVLFLRNLSSLLKICHGSLGATSFSRLTTIILECCNQLKSLFPFSVVRQLLQLKEIGVMDCSNMAEIVDEEGQGGNSNIAEANQNFELVQLRSLKLQRLPNFIRLWHGNEEINDTSSNLTPLFHEKLKSVGVANCPQLRHMFPVLVVMGLQQLEELHLANCGIEEIFEIGDLDNKEAHVFSLLQLKSVRIANCPKLRHMFPVSVVMGLQQLEELLIADCGIEEIFEIGDLNNRESHVVSIPLRELYIMNLPRLKNVWTEDPKGILTFLKLKSVRVMNCPELQYMFPVSVASGLQQLEELWLSNCGIEEVVAFGGLDKAVHMFEFPSLSTLQLSSLSKLKYLSMRGTDESFLASKQG